MRRGDSKAQSGDRGGTSWNDGLHSLNGAGFSDGSVSTAESIDAGIGGTGRGGDDAVSQTTWFAPVEEISDCPGGICPVPWAVKEEVPIIQVDQVNHPPHYTEGGGIECIEAIEAQLTPEEYQGYLRGCCVKYLWRYKLKGNPIQDLKKCQWYLERLLLIEEQK